MEYQYAQNQKQLTSPNTYTYTVKYQQVYTYAGIEPILTKDDVAAIRDSGFGHVRMFLDPLVCGSWNVTTGQYVYPSLQTYNPSAFDPMNAFIEDVRLCADMGLPVVINFFPYFISPAHRNYVVKGDDPLNVKSFKKSWEAAAQREDPLADLTLGPFYQTRDYPGPWKKDFASHAGLLPQSVDQNHPLAKVWKGLTQIFKSEGLTDQEIYLQPMSEAQVGLEIPLFLPTSDPLSVGRGTKWRYVQMEAIKAIQSEYATDYNYKILVSSPQSFPHSFAIRGASGSPNPTGAWSHLFLRYLPGEGITDVNSLIYTFHMYAPFGFTHPADGSSLAYYINNKLEDVRYYHGGSFDDARDDYNAPAPVTTGSSIGSPGTSPYINVSSDYDYLSTKPYFDQMIQWKKMEQDRNPLLRMQPVMITEFGATQQGGAEGRLPVPVGWTHANFEKSPNDENRARWVYDIIQMCQHKNFGWSYFDWSAGFRCAKGTMISGADRAPAEVYPVELLAPFNTVFASGERP